MADRVLSRRTACAAAFMVFAGRARAAPPAHPKPSPATRAAAWLLGDNLSLAALLHAAGTADAAAAELFGKATRIAGGLGIALKPLPQRASDKAAALAAVTAYLIKGPGAAVGTTLGQRLGRDHEILFELSARSNLLIVLYSPKDDVGLGNAIEQRCKQLGLPPEHWRPLVAAIRARQNETAIKDLVFKLHKGIAGYLVAKVR